MSAEADKIRKQQEQLVKAIMWGAPDGIIAIKAEELRAMIRTAFNGGVKIAVTNPAAAKISAKEFDANPMNFLKDDQP